MIPSNFTPEVLGVGLVVLAMLVALFLPAIAGSGALLVVAAAAFLALITLAVRVAGAARRLPRWR